MNMLNYQVVGKTEYASAVEFALYTRQLLFPEIYHGQIPKDLQNFEQHYVHDRLGCFITVKDQNRIIGTIAYRAYDHRFDLNLPLNTVEVVKLFVYLNTAVMASQLSYATCCLAMPKTMLLLVCICIPIHFYQRLKSFGIYRVLTLLNENGLRPMTPFI